MYIQDVKRINRILIHHYSAHITQTSTIFLQLQHQFTSTCQMLVCDAYHIELLQPNDYCEALYELIITLDEKRPMVAVI